MRECLFPAPCSLLPAPCSQIRCSQIRCSLCYIMEELLYQNCMIIHQQVETRDQLSSFRLKIILFKIIKGKHYQKIPNYDNELSRA
ncbi:hypothetical protein, partial [Moorena sp. SIO3I6]|uniref:hypothetical protein n=1 Tax=Moorena sp. SIO3I6 TaxID=2607831 RepID=UPI0013FB3951